MPKYKPVCIGIGELLWDILPDDRHLGGAPANFAYHAAALGAQGVILSRVGNDENGTEALEKCAKLGTVTEHIQIDNNLPTGTVNVSFHDGQPEYEIVENVAWDNLHWEHHLRSLAKHADIVCFGTLAQRSEQTAKTIDKFIAELPDRAIKIFDINLRQNYYSKDIILKSLNQTNIVKLNDTEFDILMKMLWPTKSEHHWLAKDILEAFNLDILCITRGERGCVMIGKKDAVELPGIKIKVADTVGAGDAFTAAMAINFLAGEKVELIAQRANLLGSFVASHNGATPHLSKEILKQVIPQ